jgi:hypothetical protein
VTRTSDGNKSKHSSRGAILAGPTRSQWVQHRWRLGRFPQPCQPPPAAGGSPYWPGVLVPADPFPAAGASATADQAAALGEAGLDLAIVYLRPPLIPAVLEPPTAVSRGSADHLPGSIKPGYWSWASGPALAGDYLATPVPTHGLSPIPAAVPWRELLRARQGAGRAADGLRRGLADDQGTTPSARPPAGTTAGRRSPAADVTSRSIRRAGCSPWSSPPPHPDDVTVAHAGQERGAAL